MSFYRFLLWRKTPSHHGSALLYSAARRVVHVLFAVVFLWGLTGWGMGWW
jgi:hypothetical protein